MKKHLLCLFTLTLLLCGCGGDSGDDVADETSTISDLKNDLAFVAGKWELVRLAPTYNADSWIDFKQDASFSAYITYPAKPYYEKISGTYSYANGTIRCIDADGTRERRLTFTQITGSETYNKIRYYYPNPETGRTDSLDFELCKKVK